MAVDYLRPSGNVNNVISVSTYANIDDNVLTGAAGDGLVCTFDRNDDNDQQVWFLTNLTNTYSSISKITYHCRIYDSEDGGNGTINFRLNLNGNWTAYKTVNFTGGSFAWYSVSETGTWSNANFTVPKIEAQVGTLSSSDNYDIDVLYVEVSGTVPAGPTVYSGVSSSLSGINDSTVGSVDWGDIGGVNGTDAVLQNTYVSDDVYTIASAIGVGSESKYLRLTHFNHKIPLNATIVGIELKIERQSLANNMIDHNIRLYLDGSYIGDNKATSSYWNLNTDRIDTYGGSNDMWGVTLTPQAVNSANFGVGISAKRETGVSQAKIDQVRMIVYYTLGDGVVYQETQTTNLMKMYLGSVY